MDEEELSSYMNWHGDKPSSVGGGDNENAEVHSTARNQEARAENKPQVAPAAASAEPSATEPPSKEPPATKPPAEESSRRARAKRPAEEPPRRLRTSRMAVAGPLGPVFNENVEPLKT